MSGNILLDANIIIYLSKNLIKPEKIFENNAVYNISIISKMELLGYPFSDQIEENLIIELLNSLNILPLTDSIVNETISLRKSNKIKLPDAIIYASAEVLNAKLLTNNISDFEKINDIVELVNPID